MTILLPTLAAVVAAFCVWLTVRMVNRRERWAKWTLAAVIGLALLYVASIGPACWMSSRLGFGANTVSSVYRPLVVHYPWCVMKNIDEYSRLGAKDS